MPPKGGKCHPDRPSKVGGNKVMSDSDLRGKPIKSAFCLKCNAWKGELGLEPTPDLYIEHLCDIFDSLPIKKTGSLWVNIADSYGANYRGGGEDSASEKQLSNKGTQAFMGKPSTNGGMSKSLVGIPARFQIEMINRGWVCRNVIIWHKPSCLSGGTKLISKTQKGVMQNTIKDLVRLKPETVELWDGEKWNRVVEWIENKSPKDIKKIVLRNGEKIICTGDHKFLIDDNEVESQNLKVGDVLDSAKNSPEYDTSTPALVPFLIGALVGIFIADGCFSGDDAIVINTHIDAEIIHAYLKDMAKQYDANCTIAKTSDNGVTLTIHSKIITAIIRTYVSGKDAKTKHLTTKAWQRDKEFLKSVLSGYLRSDGHYDEHNNRWRLGFTRNRYLENDLRMLCFLLGHKIFLKDGIAKIDEQEYPCIKGMIKTDISGHWNEKSPHEIMKIEKGKQVGKFWDIVLEESPHVFSSVGGTLIHNCMPSSAKDRFTVDFEYLYFFTKQGKYYFEQQLEPMSDATKQRDKYAFSGAFKGQYRGSPSEKRHQDGAPIKNPTFYNPEGRNKRTVWYPEADEYYTMIEVLENIDATNEQWEKAFNAFYDENKTTIWSIKTQPSSIEHFAMYPEELCVTPIKAGCPEFICEKCGVPRERITEKGEFVSTGGSRTKDTPGLSEKQKQGTGYHKTIDKGLTDCGCNAGWKSGVVLDPFMGSGTTAVVATEFYRNWIGIELNPKSIEEAEKRIKQRKSDVDKRFF